MKQLTDKLSSEQRVRKKIYNWLQLQNLRVYEDIFGDAGALSQIKLQWIADELAKILNANTAEDDTATEFILGKAYHLLKELSTWDDELAADASLWLMQYEDWLQQEDE